MAFWSGEKLNERLPALITDGENSIFNPNRVDCAAYTLSIGSEVYISPTIDSNDRESRTISALGPGEAFAIPPGQFAFLITREFVKVPEDAIALISMRAKVKWRGLVNVSGFHVDPGFHGQLTFAVFNAGPSPIHLKQGEAWFLIWYADLDRPTLLGKKDTEPPGMKSDLISGISGGMLSLDGLSSRIDKVELEQKYYSAVAAVLVTLFIGLILLAGGIFLKQRPYTVAPNATPAASRPSLPGPTHKAH